MSIASEVQQGRGELVSVVVAAHNAEAWITGVVDAIRAQTYEQLEIVVVDDGSSDRTRDLVASMQQLEPRLRLIAARHGGTAHTVTRGLHAATGAVVCLISHDCYAVSDWVERVIVGFSDPDVGIVRGPVLPAREILVPFFHCMVVDHDSVSFDGVCIAYRATALDAAGRYFEPALSRNGDDADLGWRIVDLGYRHVWLTDPTAYHDVVPRSFWSGIRASGGVFRFALLVRAHPGMRSHLRLGFLWGGRARYAKVALLHAAVILAAIGQLRPAAVLAVLLLAATVVDGAHSSLSAKLRLRDRLLTVPLEKLLRDVVGSYALAYGSIRYRSLVF